MRFQECLNNYIEEIQCRGKELAKNSGISETVLSRYRKGERVPAEDSEYLEKLAEGITKTAAEKGIKVPEARTVLQTLKESLESEKKEPDVNSQKLDILLRELEVNLSKIALFLHYDPSYLSKIRTGKRTPAHPQEFVDRICEYISANYKDEQDRKKVVILIGCEEEKLGEGFSYKEILRNWLCSEKLEEVDYVSGFLLQSRCI